MKSEPITTVRNLGFEHVGPAQHLHLGHHLLFPCLALLHDVQLVLGHDDEPREAAAAFSIHARLRQGVESEMWAGKKQTQ